MSLSFSTSLAPLTLVPNSCMRASTRSLTDLGSIRSIRLPTANLSTTAHPTTDGSLSLYEIKSAGKKKKKKPYLLAQKNTYWFPLHILDSELTCALFSRGKTFPSGSPRPLIWVAAVGANHHKCQTLISLWSPWWAGRRNATSPGAGREQRYGERATCPREK